MASILPNGKTQFVDSSGKPLANGTVTFYAPGTTTKQDTWQDQAQTQVNANPVVLDSRGQATIWGSGAYRQVVADRFGAVIWDQVVSEPTGALAAASGAALIGFQQVGGGAVVRTVQDKERDFVSARDYLAPSVTWDGTADVTQAIQLALNTGKHVLVPDGGGLISSTLQMMSNGQRLWGPGILTATAALAAAPVISAANLSNVSIDDLTIVAGNTYQAVGIQLANVTAGRVRRVRVSQHGFGISLNSCSQVLIEANDFTSAAPDPRFGLSSSSDIYVYGSSDGNIVARNTCRSAAGYGVQVRTDGAVNCTDTVVSENIVEGYNSYGIMCYRHDTSGSITGTTIVGNHVKNISGARPNTPGGTDYIFGAGIYLQGAEYSVVSGNELSACNMSTTIDQLAPGAIGLANTGVGVVSKNVIRSTGWYGIHVNDAIGLGATTGALIISDNNICGTGKDNIKAVAKVNLRINGNSCFGATGNGMTFTRGATTTWLDRLGVIGNTITGASSNGISIANARNATVSTNNVSSCGSDGISLTASQNVTLIGNASANEAARGMNIDNTNTGTIVVDGNNFDGNAVGAIIDSAVVFGQNGNDSSAASQYSGAFAPNQTLPDGNATPTVTGLRFVQSKPTAALAITNLQGGVIGDKLTIQANNANTTVQNNANILLAGSADFVMTNNSTLSLVKTAGAWVETGRSAH
ncbi:TPA: right-handed parallel beta-helix repeat-containing protein [Burkholderia vietnamiensis]|nr:right-handed parallel beta-helix repeat-containing protein [Burkholderia vietnamiensis]